jgi:hypothetical protein
VYLLSAPKYSTSSTWIRRVALPVLAVIQLNGSAVAAS